MRSGPSVEPVETSGRVLHVVRPGLVRGLGVNLGWSERRW